MLRSAFGIAEVEVRMPIVRVTYGLVAAGRALPRLDLEKVNEDVSAYLLEHLKSLDARAHRTPPAYFLDGSARQRFEHLKSGSDDQFLDVSGEMASRLLGRMDRRMPDGLFVAARIMNDSGDARVAVMKLQVAAPHAGYLRDVKGRVQLAAVKDALDAPGELQKGGVYPDARSDSDVLIGDQLDVGAIYFLDVLGLRQDESPKAALSAVYHSLSSRLPDKRKEIASSIQRRRPDTVSDALDGIIQDLPETQPLREEIEKELHGGPRRPHALDPRKAASMRRVISAHGIEVRGPIGEMNERVAVEPLGDGRWQVVATFDAEPSDTIRP